MAKAVCKSCGGAETSRHCSAGLGEDKCRWVVCKDCGATSDARSNDPFRYFEKTAKKG